MQDLIWTLVGLALTLMIFSYLFGDNVLFRVASYIFVGVSAGYVAVVVIYQVLWPRLIVPMVNGSAVERILLIVPLLLGLLMLAKASPRLARFGGLPMAYLVGVGAAVTIGGALFGTLSGQIRGAVQPFSPFGAGAGFPRLAEGLVMLAGVIATLAYFQFGAPSRAVQPAGRRGPLMEGLSSIGKAFIAVTLGAIFAGVYAAAVTALLDRLQSVLTVIAQLISG